MATLGPCNPATKIVIEQKIVIETCVRRTGSNVYNALMSTLGALTCTHKYLLRPETPWENDIGLIKEVITNISGFLATALGPTWSQLKPHRSQRKSPRSQRKSKRSQREPQLQIFEQSLQIHWPCMHVTQTTELNTCPP